VSKPSGDYLWDKSGPRDPELVRLEGVLGKLGQQGEPPALPARLRAARFGEAGFRASRHITSSQTPRAMSGNPLMRAL